MIEVSIKRRELFARAEIDEMYRLHSQFFNNSRRETFASDFHAKDWVIVVSEGASIVGFSTIAVTESAWKSRELIVLFSGDTIVQPDHWGSNALIPAFGEFILYCHEKYPGRRVVWHLISKGYRTYRILPVFFLKFFPCPDSPTPPAVQELLDHMSFCRFGEQYDKSRGIVSFDGNTDYLCDELAEILEMRKNNRHTRFFLERNPGYRQGDELSCVTDLAMDNIKPLALKMISRSHATWISGNSG